MSSLLDPLWRLFDATSVGPDGRIRPCDGSGSGSGSGSGAAVPLYACDACDRVYISERMDTCSGCGRPVERIPNEAELGLRAD